MFGTYLNEISASIGFKTLAPAPSLCNLFELDLVKFEGLFALVGFPDRFGIYSIECESWIFEKRDLTVLIAKILPNTLHVAYTHSGCLSAVEFADINSGIVFHVIRLTDPIVSIWANFSTVAILLSTGRVHLYDATSLEERSNSGIQTMKSFALSDRWAAYSGLGGVPVQTFAGALTTMGQDAFDNLVLSTMLPVSSVMSPPTSPPNERSTRLIIYDVVAEKTLTEIDNPAVNRPIEALGWSACGTRLLVCAGNGHSVQVYDAAQGFTLLHQLNRGVTPAVVKYLGGYGERSVILTTKGTAHLFNPDEKIRDADSIMLTANGYVYLRRMEIVKPEHTIVLSEDDLHVDPNWKQKLRAIEPSSEYQPMGKTGVWMSPLIDCGRRFNAPVKDAAGALLGAAAAQPAEWNSAAVAAALAVGLRPQRKHKYSESTKEGFVQIL